MERAKELANQINVSRGERNVLPLKERSNEGLTSDRKEPKQVSTKLVDAVRSQNSKDRNTTNSPTIVKS